MKSLYSKFILVGLSFISISLGLQFMWWKRGRIVVYETTVLPDTDIKIKSDTNVGIFTPTPICNSLDGGCGSRSAGSKATVDIRKKKASDIPFIWDTGSGHDRIPDQMKHIPLNILNGDNRTRVILVDSGPVNWNVKEGKQTFIDHQCPVQNCKLVDKSTSEKRIDAILFGQDIGWLQEYESKYRHPDSVWIFFALESPMATGKFDFVRQLNWTATYRRDSTMVAPYERWLRFDNASSITRTRNYAKGKSKMAAMFVSNCAASNGRLEYAKELKQYVEVDIYGYCGDKQCARNNAKTCFGMLNKDYKFYLAFENANCRDYITEKFFVNGLSHDVIPIVMGAHPEDYEEVAPPHSYIHVENFKSAKELAEYMKMLDKNDELYNEYFNWKGTGSFLNTKFWCRLCSLVSDDKKPRLIVENLETWWRSTDTCRNGRWTD
ncbi:glycoprotein 3-alpha-L-fucosyltransferase A-like [Haliotis asinina]|uniref:glycoprotein 3-alpha-L-fucosyltransferase A-like n=1 Tax=Haliotis asinina TaxID=109174 RepID=UPI0035319B20